MREKTSLLACSLSVLVTFLTSFTMPYLINTSHGIGGKVGFLYGSLCMAMNVAAYFWVPEMKGRSLEEIDALFAAGVPLRQFRSAVLHDSEEEEEEEEGERSSEGEDKCIAEKKVVDAV